MNAASDLRLVRWFLLPVVIAAVVSGCFVTSVNPWLDKASATLTPSLAGVWVDTNKFPQIATASFLIAPQGKGYDLLLTNTREKVKWRYECTLHDLGDTLLLQVGPPDGVGNRSPGAILPAYLLFRVEFTGTVLKLYSLDKDLFVKRADKNRLVLVETARQPHNRTNRVVNVEPVIVGSSTEKLEKFLCNSLKDKTLFLSDPAYFFTRVGTNVTAAEAESPNREQAK